MRGTGQDSGIRGMRQYPRSARRDQAKWKALRTGQGRTGKDRTGQGRLLRNWDSRSDRDSESELGQVLESELGLVLVLVLEL